MHQSREEGTPARPLSAAALAAIRERHRGAPARSGMSLTRTTSPADRVPLTPAQEWLWRLQHGAGMRRDVPAPFVLPFAVRLRGPLDLAHLRHALGETAWRHEVLRTRFVQTAGEVHSVVTPVSKVPLAVSRFADRPPDPALIGPFLAERARRERRRPADLANEPLLRGRVFQFGPADHLLLLVAHRMIMDEQSAGLLLRELHQRLDPAPATQQRLREPLPAQLRDFAAWVAGWRRGAAARPAAAFWAAQAENLSPPRLPALPGGSPLVSCHAARVERVVDSETTVGLRQLAQRHHVTLYMTLFAALHALLAPAAAGPMAIATQVPGRTVPETAAMIGRFAHPISLRAEPVANPTFAELLGQARRAVLATAPYQSLPWAPPAATTGGHGAVDAVALTLTDEAAPAFADAGDLAGEWLPVEADFAPVALTFAIAEHAAALTVRLVYQSERFAPPAMAQLLDQFTQLLAAVVADPTRRLSDLPAPWPAAAPTIATYAATTPPAMLAAGEAPAPHPDPAATPAAAPRLTVTAPAAGDATPTEALVGRLWREALDRAAIGRDDDFFDLGGDSFLLVRLAAHLSEQLGREVSPALFFSAPTIAQLAAAIDAAGAETGGSPASAMIALQPAGAERPIFFVPGGVGDAAALYRFAGVARAIGLDRPCYGFCATTAAPAAVIEDDQAWVTATAASYVRELRARQPAGPYVLTGLCIGGLLAYAMAQELLAAGEAVPNLILIDTRHPTTTRASDGVLARQANRQRRAERRRRRADRQGVADDHPAPAAAAAHSPVALASSLLTSPRVQHLKRYQPAPYRGRITLLANADWHAAEPTLGWDPAAIDALVVQPIPGAHGDFLRGHAADLADLLRQLVREAEAPFAAPVAPVAASAAAR